MNIFNLGVDDFCELDDSVRWIVETLGIQPEVNYTGGNRGWIGDNPFILLDTTRIRRLGWEPRVSIREGVIKTVRFIRENQWVLTERE